MKTELRGPVVTGALPRPKVLPNSAAAGTPLTIPTSGSGYASNVVPAAVANARIVTPTSARVFAGSPVASAGATSSFALSPTGARYGGSGTTLSPTGSIGQAKVLSVGQASPVASMSANTLRVVSTPTNQVTVAAASYNTPTSMPGTPMAVRQAKVLSGGLPVSTNPVFADFPQAAQGVVIGALGGPASTQVNYEQKHSEDAQLSNLKALKKACGLKKVPVGTAVAAFKNAAIDGKLTREQWFAAHSALLDECQVEHPPMEVKSAVFDLFDRDDNDVVDMIEIVCGTSLLCKGSEDDKVEAVFNMFDENGDGLITVDEMHEFLNTVFKVVCTPDVMKMVENVGVKVDNLDDMASATTMECFYTADLNHDGRLSLDEFKKWFSAPKNDPSLLFQPVKSMLN